MLKILFYALYRLCIVWINLVGLYWLIYSFSVFNKYLLSDYYMLSYNSEQSRQNFCPQKLMFMLLFIYTHLQVLPVQTEDTTSLSALQKFIFLSIGGQRYFIIPKKTMYISQYSVRYAICTMQGARGTLKINCEYWNGM